MDLKAIKQLIDMLEGTEVSEIEVTRKEQTVHIKRGLGVQAPAAPQVVSAPPPAPAVPAVVPAAPAAAAPAVETPAAAPGNAITSPMVGTFYRAPSPEASVFVEEGDMVKKGQVVCIIEAMKLMNEIEADISGRITKILLENASPVEYGEALFLIEPA